MYVVDLLCGYSSTPSSLHVQFSLLNILVFHLFVDIILISIIGGWGGIYICYMH